MRTLPSTSSEPMLPFGSAPIADAAAALAAARARAAPGELPAAGAPSPSAPPEPGEPRPNSPSAAALLPLTPFERGYVLGVLSEFRAWKASR